MIVFLLFLGVMALFVTLGSLLRVSKGRQYILLGIFGVSLATYLIGSAIAVGDYYVRYPHLAGIGDPFFVLLPALVYLVIKEILGEQIKIRDGIHILPFSISIGLMTPFYVLSASEKVRAYDTMLELVFQNSTDMLLPGLSVIVVAFYGFSSQRLIESWHKKVYQLSSDPDVLLHSVQDGLRWLIWSMVAMVIALLLLSIRQLDGISYHSIIAIGFGLTYLRIAFALFFKGQDQMPDWIGTRSVTSTIKPVLWPEFLDEADLSCTPADEGFTWTNSEYAQLSPYEIRQQAWHTFLDQSVNMHQWWREPDVSINDVSERIGLSEDLLKRLLLERERCTFFEYINHKRIEAIKKKITDPTFHIKDTRDLVNESGFRSLKTLKQVFLYYTGSSLKTYKRLASFASNNNYHQ